MASSFSSSLIVVVPIDVRRPAIQKLKSNVKQPRSPSGGGKVDQGLCIGNGLARQPVVDSFANATIHGWAAAGD